MFGISESENKIQLTREQIKKDLLTETYLKLAGFGGLFLLTLLFVIFINSGTGYYLSKVLNSQGAVSSEVWKQLISAAITDIIMAVILIIEAYVLAPLVKRVCAVWFGELLIVEDELAYITSVEEVRYRKLGRVIERSYVTVDVLHFSAFGEFKLNEHPTSYEGKEKFYLVTVGHKKKIIGIYPQKTYFYK
jgi:hypothetical protein